jgi:hypothetical protein
MSRRDMKHAQASAAEYKIPHAFDSVADLRRYPEVDAVLAATPNCSHLRDVLVAIESGKPVLCEKPMGMNGGECRQMVGTARRAKLLLSVSVSPWGSGQAGFCAVGVLLLFSSAPSQVANRRDDRWWRAHRRSRSALYGRPALHPR